jgi:hypothetical protein
MLKKEKEKKKSCYVFDGLQIHIGKEQQQQTSNEMSVLS